MALKQAPTPEQIAERAITLKVNLNDDDEVVSIDFISQDPDVTGIRGRYILAKLYPANKSSAHIPAIPLADLANEIRLRWNQGPPPT